MSEARATAEKIMAHMGVLDDADMDTVRTALDAFEKDPAWPRKDFGQFLKFCKKTGVDQDVMSCMEMWS